jgi:DNA-directed RNA polymerase subunit RPC12/RpoP
MAPDEPRLPDSCPACLYSFEGLSYEGDEACCPECGLTILKYVPAMKWPFRCAHCKADLTGEAIFAQRVRCPKCALMQWSETLSPQRRSVLRTVLVTLLVVVILSPVIVFLLGVIAGMVWPVLSP